MARELKVEILLWCDPCLKDGIKTEGRERTFSIDGAKPKVLTTCDPHNDKAVEPFVQFFEEFAIANPKAKKPTKPAAPAKATSAAAGSRRPEREAIREGEGVVCQLCVRAMGMDPGEVTMKNEDSLSVHRGQRHKVSATNYRLFVNGMHEPTAVDRETGRIEFADYVWPNADDETFTIPEYLHCPDCGEGFDPRPKGERSAWASMAGHRNKQHGYQGTKAA